MRAVFQAYKTGLRIGEHKQTVVVAQISGATGSGDPAKAVLAEQLDSSGSDLTIRLERLASNIRYS
jgi:hypothetical protein